MTQSPSSPQGHSPQAPAPARPSKAAEVSAPPSSDETRLAEPALSANERLRALISDEVAYPQACLASVGFLLEGPLLGFVLYGGDIILESGVARWQELAVLTPETLVLWIASPSDSAEGRPHPEATLDVETRLIPIHQIREVNISQAFSPEGVLHGISCAVTLATQDRVFHEAEEHTPSDQDSEHSASAHLHRSSAVMYDMLRFKGHSGDQLALERVREFATQLLSRANAS